ncbi:MAG: T9SS type A sorting domain-containing protein [Flavobacteriales bacterium]|nr:T9SS type A sorting domain-containing protein [Flavobacteriales bacterium]
MKKILRLICLFFLAQNLNAQMSLPYFSGFENGSQTLGWVEYKKAATTHSHWGINLIPLPNPSAAFSGQGYIGHDYSPSTGITLTDNWMVSPSFSIPNGGTLDSIRHKFWGFYVPGAGDTIGLYLLNGSQDPALATSTQLLFDFRNTNYIADNAYRIKTNIALPAMSGSSYFAVRYRNADCSSNWLTVYFDNIAISGNSPVGLNESIDHSDKITISPNPTSGKIRIDSELNIDFIEIYNIAGKVVYSGAYNKELDLSSYSKGIHFIKFQSKTNTYIKRVISF